MDKLPGATVREAIQGECACDERVQTIGTNTLLVFWVTAASETLNVDIKMGNAIVLLDGERVGLDDSLDELEYGTFQVMSTPQRGGTKVCQFRVGVIVYIHSHHSVRNQVWWIIQEFKHGGAKGSAAAKEEKKSSKKDGNNVSCWKEEGAPTQSRMRQS